MKGISMLLTFTLLVLAHLLALHLKRSGTLPSAQQVERLSSGATSAHPHPASVAPMQI